MKTIRILIADDHSIVRNGLRSLFSTEPGFSVVAEASNGQEVLGLVEKHKPDVAILDLSMPTMNGIDVTRVLKEKKPEIKILILTIHANEEYVYQMVREGANGYVLKNAEKEEIFSAVRAVVGGERFFSPSISNLLIDGLVKRGGKPSEARSASDSKLSARETEVLVLIAEGHTNKEIAQKLFLSVSTINTHRTNIMKKLDIHDTAGLVRYAIKSGIVKAAT